MLNGVRRWEDGVQRKLDVLANVATVVACCIVSYVLLTRSAAPPMSSADYKAGEQMDKLRDVDYSQAAQTLVMFVRSSCHFCTESMPFYERVAISHAHTSGHLHIVALTGEPVETTAKYLADHSVAIDQVVPIDSNGSRFTGTPTLVLVDRNGTVTHAWRGKLNEERERELFQLLGDSVAVSSLRAWNATGSAD